MLNIEFGIFNVEFSLFLIHKILFLIQNSKLSIKCQKHLLW